MLRRVLLFIFILSLAGGLLTGCGTSAAATSSSSSASTSTGHEMPMAPMSMMPDDVKSAPLVTQQAYQFAVANPDVMQHIPWYCGCGSMGHTSNYSCYVKSVDAVCKLGDIIPVKLLLVDDQGRLKLSRKAAMAELGLSDKKLQTGKK